MKTILLVFIVLTTPSVADAALTISVNGEPDAPRHLMYVFDTAVIDIHATETASALLIVQGPGMLDAGSPTYLWEQSTVADVSQPLLDDYARILADRGYPGVTDIVEIQIVDVSEPVDTPGGLVIDGIVFTCLGCGEMPLTLMDLDLNVYDAQIMQEYPEPMTLLLFGLGGLSLRRRR